MGTCAAQVEDLVPLQAMPITTKGLFGCRLSRGVPGIFPGRTNPGTNWPGLAHQAIWLPVTCGFPVVSAFVPGSAFHHSRGGEPDPRLARDRDEERRRPSSSGDRSLSRLSPLLRRIVLPLPQSPACGEARRVRLLPRSGASASLRRSERRFCLPPARTVVSKHPRFHSSLRKQRHLGGRSSPAPKICFASDLLCPPTTTRRRRPSCSFEEGGWAEGACSRRSVHVVGHGGHAPHGRGALDVVTEKGGRKRRKRVRAHRGRSTGLERSVVNCGSSTLDGSMGLGRQRRGYPPRCWL